MTVSLCKRLKISGVLLVLLVALAHAHDEAATWSLSAGEHGTCRKTIIKNNNTIIIDLSLLPERAEIFRAVLRCRRSGKPGWRFEGDTVVVVPVEKPERPLPLLPPRYTSLDATEPVAAAVKAGRRRLELLVKSFREWKPETLRLDVSFSGGKAKNAIPRATALTVRHRSGQTMLTFREPNPLTAEPELPVRQYQALRKSLEDDPRELTFRIYRSTTPITAATIASAELTDEIRPLTCYNADYYGIYPQEDDRLPRYVVEDGAEPVPPGTGIYAHYPQSPGRAHYAVSVAVAGEEDFTALGTGNALAKPVEEKPGPGRPILQKIEKPEKFFYTEGVTLHFYVRWEAPPRCNLPSQPYDYLSDPHWVRTHPTVDLPFVGFGNGKNDHGIGWTHAVDFLKALQEARQPHAMIWNLRGHGAGTFHAKDLDLRCDQSLPAFTGCSFDDDIGTASKLPRPKPFTHSWGETVKDIYDGDPEGQINSYLRWREPADNAFPAVYGIYRKGPGGEWQKIAESVLPEYVDTVTAAGRYAYRVTAADYDNNVSKPSDEVIVSLSATGQASGPDPRFRDRINYAEHIRRIHAAGQGKVRHDVVLFAGDSITAADAYTNMLGQWLGRGIPVRRGVGTVRTDYGKNLIGQYLTEVKPEFAVVMYGTNDSKSPEAVRQAIQNLEAVIDACDAFGTVPILATIPPRGYDKEKQEGQVRFNNALIELCHAKKVPISYCFEEMMQRDLRRMLGDGVHLTPQDGNDAAGEALWKTMQHVSFALRDAGDS